ncbi:MAG: hypothetical protein L3K17_08580, partial [Thermoplasmata archaeon]|nr:hypothetical protein [Thermoplasmata archaeon]
SFNITCPSTCVMTMTSNATNGTLPGYWFDVQRSGSGGGVLPGGPGWFDLVESEYCGAPSGNCGYFPVQATVEVEDLGLVSP